MPSTEIKARWNSPSDLGAWLSRHAAELLVSPIALYWRLVNLDLIDKGEQPPPSSTKAKSAVSRPLPQLYNRAFVQRLHTVLDRGHLTALRAVEVLDCSLPELVHLFRSYELEPPFPP